MELTLSENSKYSTFSGAGLVTVSNALYALRAFSLRSSESPSTFHGSLDDADARLLEKTEVLFIFSVRKRVIRQLFLNNHRFHELRSNI